MKILVTGHLGYIGAVLMPLLEKAGHEPVGLDIDLFAGCNLGDEPLLGDTAECKRDVRDVKVTDLAGFDSIVHLAALSNDPLGNLNAELTREINLRASVRLAEVARQAGIGRFVFSSSCSVYGAAGENFLDESATFNPVTPYAESKVAVEAALSALADRSFAPTYLRNATAYGASPRLRLDLVVNEMAARALTEGHIIVKSDGTPWRPLVHLEDIAAAILASLQAPVEAVASQAFNVGRTQENFTVREIAELVRATVPGCVIDYAVGGGPDKRSYRVDFTKAETSLPGFKPTWTLQRGIEQLVGWFRSVGLAADDVNSSRYIRLARVQELVDANRLDTSLRWRTLSSAAAG